MMVPVVNTYGKDIPLRVYQECRTHPASLAVIGGHEVMVRFMIGLGVNANLRDGDGFTLLALASIYGHTSLANFLLSQGARQNIHRHMSHYPLWLAAFHGYEDLVAFLVADLKEGWADGLLEKIQDAVWAAVVAGRTSMVWYLVERHNAPVIFAFINGDRATPLMRAAGDGRADMVRLLLELGAEIDVGSSLSPHVGLFRSPLAEAVKGNHEEVAQILVGLSPPIVRTRVLATCIQAREMLLNNGTSPEFREEDIPEHGEDEDGSGCVQPLLLAVINLDLDMVKLLLDKGANANLRCEEQPLNSCTIFYQHVLFWAIERGHQNWRRLEKEDQTKYLGNSALVNLLLEGGANPNKFDLFGQTPLTYAVRDGDDIVVKCLLDHGANPYWAVDSIGQKLISVRETKGSI